MGMNRQGDQTFEDWVSGLEERARSFEYPPTPDLVAAVRQRTHPAPRRPATRRWALGVAIAIILALAVLMSVPPVRAAVLDFLSVGVIRIFLNPPTATPLPPTQTGTLAPSATPGPSLTPAPTATPLSLPALLGLVGETTLDRAGQDLGFPLRLPSYPPDLGQPDRVYRQFPRDDMVILVWLSPEQPDEIGLALFAIGPDSWVGEKWEPRDVTQTTVNGQPALWARGPYALLLRNGEIDHRYLVAGHALIWEQDGITYRLEGDLTMEEAVRIAESLEP